MGLNDVISNTLLRVRADTSQAKSEIRSLRGAEKQAATDRLAELEKTNAGIDKQMAMWGKATLAIGASVAAYKLAQAAARAYLEDIRLESAAAGANVDRLKMATRGLVETDTLLAFAGKAQHGVWKLNQAEMETVLRGATALKKTMGVELQPTIEALTESIAKGSTRALKEFGIEATDKAGALKQLDSLYKSLGGNVDVAGDEFERAGVKFSDSMDDMMGQLGKFVVSLQPLISALAEVAGILAGVAGSVGSVIDTGDSWMAEAGDTFTQGFNRESIFSGAGIAGLSRLNRDSFRKRKAAERAAQEAALIAGFQFGEIETPNRFNASEDLVPFDTSWADPKREKQQLKFLGNRMGMAGLDVNAIGQGIASGFMAGIGKLRTDKTFEAINDNGGFTGQSINASFASGQESISKMLEDFARFDAEKKEKGSILTQIFGTPAEISDMAVQIEIAASAFNILSQAAGSAFGAWIDGSKSLGAAFSEAIAEGLKAAAVQMFVESIKHTAFGFGALAFGPIMGASAAAHFKAAGLFAAGAAVAGTAAKGLGHATGQWSQGGTGASGGSASGPARTISGGQASSQPAAPITIYVGAEWASMSAIDQSAAIVRAIDLGRRGSPSIRRH